MRYAIFSDIHGNRQAWKAVAEDMERLEVQVHVCLGDVVGYGPCPLEVLRAIRERTENIVVGNHDAAAAGTMDASVFNPVARKAIAWTRDHLDEESLAFLSQLPLAIESEDLLFVHAEVIEPGRFGYIETIEDARHNFAAKNHRVTFVGHTHYPTLFCLEENGTVSQLPDQDCVLEEGRRYIVNVGSVGEPRTFDDIRASYVIYDSDTRKLYFRRIAFDPEAYRRDLASTALEVTPFFLTTFDHHRAEAAAVRAMAGGAAVTMAPAEVNALGARSLVVPIGVAVAGGTSAMTVPGVQPNLHRRRSGMRAALVLLPLLALLTGGVIIFALKGGGKEADSGLPISGTGSGAPPEAKLAIFGPPEEAQAFKSASGEAVESRSEISEPSANAPGVATVPDPNLPPPAPTPAPESPDRPAPNPVPAPSPAPVPEPVPAVAELPVMEGLGKGLIFYAPFDEPVGTQVARDLSPGGRDLNVTSARMGEPGQLGLACQIDHGGSVTSAGKALPAKWQGLTISFWLRIPPKPAPGEGEAVVPDPPGNLVSLHEYIETRMENGQIVANLDRMGEDVRLDFPRDDKWHHVMVENAGAITSIWIDGGLHSPPLLETIPPGPPGEVAVWIGSPESRFAIDEVAIWNRAFTREERLNLYRRGQHGSPVLTPARTLALWSFEDESGSKLLRDSVGANLLGVYGAGERVPAIAPDPVPLNDKPNKFAIRLSRAGEAPEKRGTFQLTAEAPFTYEGWVKFSGAALGGTLGGTLSGAEEKGAHGWRVAARREQGVNGHLAFIYETGEEKVQALPEESLPLFDGQAHHFAAVWNPADSETHGKLALYFDNEEVATASLALGDLRPDAAAPFRIEADRAPMVLDEIRFSALVLKPELFLTANQSPNNADDPLHQGESLLERRDRERREERLRQIEERQRKDAERQREIEERRAEEEAKRNRTKLGID